MAEQTEVKWPTCEQGECIGIRLASARKCLEHAGEEDKAAAMKLFGETGVIDARGVTITNALLERILTAVPRGKNKEPLIESCRFDRATFRGFVRFLRATFRGDAGFNQVTFRGDAWFGGATFRSGAWFDEGTFRGRAGFSRATFNGYAWFGGATFRSRAGFGQTTFRCGAGFGGATFRGRAVFDEAVFHGRAWFSSVSFEQTRQFGPLLAHRGLVMDGVQFAQPVQIEVSSTALCCRRARFAGGAQFRVRWARVVLDDTDLSAPSILAGTPRLSSEELACQEEQIARAWLRLLPGQVPGRPQLMSLRRADVAGLGLNSISAADCRFADAHNLDKLRLESGVSFAIAPPPACWSRGGRRWAGREVIAEERAWRADRPDRRWAAPGWPSWLGKQQPDALDPGQIAGLYRALRKSREDDKDEPGAADFYYGEMEMRRARPRRSNHSGQSGPTSRGRVERCILTAYWLVSGYSLRAWRAVTWLAVITALFAVAFHLVGFAAPPRPASYWTSLLYAFRATLSLTDNQVTLTAWGSLLQAVLRLTGPVLLGLALLALRGRVKR
jgi:hypothetical protein